MKKINTLAGLPAELIVAGKMAARGWNIYSPHRDVGFDFIATLKVEQNILIRPVQVKGCYFEKRKDSPYYGKSNMDLTATHDEMVLAIPYFFPEKDNELTLQFIAYMPWNQLRSQPSGRFRTMPAKVKTGRPTQRRDFLKFFDDSGMIMMEQTDWKNTAIGVQNENTG